MKRIFFTLALCLAAATSAGAATPGEIAEGGTLREVTMRSLGGEPKALSAFRGKPLIINVWASYCPPCLQEMGSLERLATRYGKQIRVIGISIDDYPERAQAFLARAKTTFPHFIDQNLVIEHMLGADRIPLTVLVDAHGRVLHKVYGAREWDDPDMVKAIGEAFGIPL